MFVVVCDVYVAFDVDLRMHSECEGGERGCGPDTTFGLGAKLRKVIITWYIQFEKGFFCTLEL